MNLEYSDIHRGFLQVLMSRGCISDDDAHAALGELLVSRMKISFITTLDIYMLRPSI